MIMRAWQKTLNKTELGDALKDEAVLLLRERLLADAGVQLVVPALAALLAFAQSHARCDSAWPSPLN